MAVKPIPDGYSAITPYLYIRGAAGAIEFYKTVFGAVERMRMPGPDGRLMHAEIEVGGSVIMLADECLEMNVRSPQTLGGVSSSILLYVPNVDTCVTHAVDAGAKLVRPIKDQFYGDRSGTLEDPYGHVWTIATHVEDVSPAEMERRAAAMQPPGD